MGLRDLFGSLKANCSSPTSTSTAATANVSPRAAVLLATARRPSTDPPLPKHIDALLSLGAATQPVVTATARALSARLAAARDPSAALKCLLAVHHVLTRGTDSLRNELVAALGKELPYTSFHGSLSSWIGWYAAIIERILAALRTGKLNEECLLDSQPSAELLKDMERRVDLVEAISRAPIDNSSIKNALVNEVVIMAGKEKSAAKKEISTRVKTIIRRLDSLQYADSVELVCELRRLEDFKHSNHGFQPLDGRCMVDDDDDDGGFWEEMSAAKKKAAEVLVRLEMEERGMGRRFRARIGESARFPVAAGSVELVDFRSNRWVGPISV